jgi:hypothetical protein
MNAQSNLALTRVKRLEPPYSTWRWARTKAGEMVKQPLLMLTATHVNKGKVYPYASWRQGDRRWW